MDPDKAFLGIIALIALFIIMFGSWWIVETICHYKLLKSKTPTPDNSSEEEKK